MIQRDSRTTKEEVDEEVNLMQKEAEMSLDELKAMYTRMAQQSSEQQQETSNNEQTDHNDKVRIELILK